MGYNVMSITEQNVDVIEVPYFKKKVAKLLSEKEHELLIEYVSRHPTKGDVIPGTSGVRKLRFAAKNKGKRGGARIIYFYFIQQYEVYLLDVYVKNEQSDISPKDKKLFKEIIASITDNGGNHG